MWRTVSSTPRSSAACPTEARRRFAAGVAGLLCVALLTGCLGGAEDDSREAALGPATAEQDPAPATPEQLLRQAQRVLDQRARAVRRGDLQLFLRSVDGDAEFVARQERYFRSVEQLPWQSFAYEVLETSWDVRTRPRWGQVVVPEVVQRTRLRGFDTRAVERTVGFVFSYTAAGVRLVSDRGAGGQVLYRGTPAPWDLTEVEVRQEPGVLGVFDTDSVESAPAVMAAVRDGIDDLDRLLPFVWPRKVVVYSIRDPAFLDSFTDVPGGSIDLLGAVTFPMYSESGPSPVASTRMLLLDSSVVAGEPFLGRIVRHELSHVALGSADDAAPTWLSEGLAEYVGARPVPVAERVIPTAALQRAREPVAGMPGSAEFNGADQEWHYALSWMACDHIAATAGEEALWRLLEELSATGRPDRDTGQERVLQRVLGYGSAELARRAAARIQNLYGGAETG